MAPGDHVHAECLRDGRDLGSQLAEPDHAQRHALDILPHGGLPEFATVHARSPEQAAHLRPKELLAAIVDLSQPEAMAHLARRHPALPQIVTGTAGQCLPITPWLHLTRPAKLGLLLTALNQLHRRR